MFIVSLRASNNILHHTRTDQPLQYAGVTHSLTADKEQETILLNNAIFTYYGIFASHTNNDIWTNHPT